MTLRRILLVLVVVVVLLAAGMVLYAFHVQAMAAAVIRSASEIHSTADAERESAAWRARSNEGFSENTSPNGDHSYEVRIENGLLHRLRLVPPTIVGLTITMRNGELRYVLLAMFTGTNSNKTAGVWIQEWFGSGSTNDFRVNPKDKPWKATVEFSSAVPEAERKRAFELNTRCFIQPGGCSNAEEILPEIWVIGRQ